MAQQGKIGGWQGGPTGYEPEDRAAYDRTNWAALGARKDNADGHIPASLGGDFNATEQAALRQAKATGEQVRFWQAHPGDPSRTIQCRASVAGEMAAVRIMPPTNEGDPLGAGLFYKVRGGLG